MFFSCEDSFIFTLSICLDFISTILVILIRLHPENMSLKRISSHTPLLFSKLGFTWFTGYEYIFFLFLVQNIDCVYTLEAPRRVGSKEYQQSMFWGKNKNNRYMYVPLYPSFYILSGV